MNQILRLYKFYLKKLFKGWWFWTSLALFWFVFIILPLIMYFMSGGRQYDGIGRYVTVTYKESMGMVLKDILEFFSGKHNTVDYPIFSTIWKMFLSVWWLGIVGMFFLINPAINNLIGEPKEDGEDKTVLTTASPIKRNDVVLAKIGAFFSFFVLTNLIAVVLPVFAYYCWAGSSQGIFTASFAFSFLALAGLVFPLLLTLLIYSILFFMNMVLSRLSAILFSTVLWIFPYLWQTAMKFTNPSKGFYRFLDKGKELMFTQPLFIIPLCLGVGSLFFYLYWNNFTKRDFN